MCIQLTYNVVQTRSLQLNAEKEHNGLDKWVDFGLLAGLNININQQILPLSIMLRVQIFRYQPYIDMQTI